MAERLLSKRDRTIHPHCSSTDRPWTPSDVSLLVGQENGSFYSIGWVDLLDLLFNFLPAHCGKHSIGARIQLYRRRYKLHSLIAIGPMLHCSIVWTVCCSAHCVWSGFLIPISTVYLAVSPCHYRQMQVGCACLQWLNDGVLSLFDYAWMSKHNFFAITFSD